MREGEAYWFWDEPYHRVKDEKVAVRGYVVSVGTKFVRLAVGPLHRMYMRLPEELYKTIEELTKEAK